MLNYQNCLVSSNCKLSTELRKNNDEYNQSNRRNLLLASLFGSLSFTLMLIIALQFRLIEFFEINNLNVKNNIFSEIKIKLEENDKNKSEEFSIFGRKLALGNGDYFLDIPYALETQRFEQAKLAPLPKDFYAINYGNGCPNGFIRTRALPDLNWNPPPLEIIPSSEQCHTLNIYRCSFTNIKNNLLPILVVINEGNWLKRSNANLEPPAIIKNFACNKNNGNDGIIVVSINYRMGFYGNFYMPGWPESKRNFALWDIKTGLEWIKQNIGYFGGNKEEITVLASGDGVKLVSLLGMLEQGKSLFKRQIFISGSLFSPSIFPSDNKKINNPNNHNMKFLISSNCLNENELNELIKNENNSFNDLKIKLENCLNKLNQQDIISIENKIENSQQKWPIITSLINNSNNNFYVPENHFSLISTIPSIIGFCTFPRNFGKGEKETAKSPMYQTIHHKINLAIKEELKENLRKMYELKKASETFWGEIESEEFIKYYLKEGEKQKIDELLNEFNEEIMENPEEIIKRVGRIIFVNFNLKEVKSKSRM
uniref:COesterase domain-containing protein n=1 Tax=Meloidogyne hapla TaxID=6305 RepID=A0A1I8BCU7_MELHA